MATATTTPELFTNVISTFIAESDMGVGTIIGSLMFNTLGVAAVAALAAGVVRIYRVSDLIQTSIHKNRSLFNWNGGP